MTPREVKVLDVVRSALEQTGVAPSMDEIGAAMGVRGKSRPHDVVSRLVAAGLLTRTPNRPRGLSLPGEPSLLTVPTARLRAELQRRGEIA